MINFDWNAQRCDVIFILSVWQQDFWQFHPTTTKLLRRVSDHSHSSCSEWRQSLWHLRPCEQLQDERPKLHPGIFLLFCYLHWTLFRPAASIRFHPVCQFDSRFFPEGCSLLWSVQGHQLVKGCRMQWTVLNLWKTEANIGQIWSNWKNTLFLLFFMSKLLQGVPQKKWAVLCCYWQRVRGEETRKEKQSDEAKAIILIKYTKLHSNWRQRNYILSMVNSYTTWISSRLNKANFIKKI